MALPEAPAAGPGPAKQSRPDSATGLAWSRRPSSAAEVDDALMDLPRGERVAADDAPAPPAARPASGAARSVASESRPLSAAYSVYTDYAETEGGLEEELSLSELAAPPPPLMESASEADVSPGARAAKASAALAAEGAARVSASAPASPDRPLGGRPVSALPTLAESRESLPPPSLRSSQAAWEEVRAPVDEEDKFGERLAEVENAAAVAQARAAEAAAANAASRIDDELAKYRARLGALRPSSSGGDGDGALSARSSDVDPAIRINAELSAFRRRLNETAGLGNPNADTQSRYFGGRAEDVHGDAALRHRIARIRSTTGTATASAAPSGLATWASSAAAEELAEMRRKLTRPEGPAGAYGAVTTTHAPALVEPERAPTPTERLHTTRGGEAAVDRPRSSGTRSGTRPASSAARPTVGTAQAVGSKALAALARLGIAADVGDASEPMASASPPSPPVAEEDGRVEYKPSVRAERWLRESRG